jgi:hypothetical protein
MKFLRLKVVRDKNGNWGYPHAKFKLLREGVGPARYLGFGMQSFSCVWALILALAFAVMHTSPTIAIMKLH